MLTIIGAAGLYQGNRVRNKTRRGLCMVKKGFLKTAVRSFVAMFLTFSLIGGGVLPVGASHMPSTLLEMKDKLFTFFIKNEGQISKGDVRYYMAGFDGSYLFFLPDGIQLGKGKDVVHFSFYGSGSGIDVVGEEPLETRVNYFVGSDEGMWKRNVPTYGKVRYRNVYPGVDVVFYMTQEGRVEYDIIARPGVNVSAVKFGIDGARDVELNENGDVRILLPSGDAVVQKAPQIYHLKENTRVKVEGKYRIEPTAEGRTLISFDRKPFRRRLSSFRGESKASKITCPAERFAV